MALWYAVNAVNDPVLSSLERTLDTVLSVVDEADQGPKGMPMAGRFDIIERKDVYELITDAPGFDPQDIAIELKEGILTISGKHEQQPYADEEGVKVWLKERRPHEFSRSFKLPDNAQAEEIAAHLDKGILSVRVPKLPPAPKPEARRITVQCKPALAA